MSSAPANTLRPLLNRAAVAATPDKAPQQGVCARHKGKFICLGITLALLVATAIAVPLLLPKDPTATLLEQSNLRLDGQGVGSVAIDLRMKVRGSQYLRREGGERWLDAL